MDGSGGGQGKGGDRGIGSRRATRLIHGRSQSSMWEYSHHAIPPITASTTFRLSSVSRGQKGFLAFGSPDLGHGESPTYIYDRLDEPTTSMLEEVLADGEGGDRAVAFACGMSAISSTLMACCSVGQSIVAHPVMYGCTYSLLTKQLPRFGITTVFADMRDPEAIRLAITADTRVVYFETPANPTLECIDIQNVATVVGAINAARPVEQRVRIVVDNTFQTLWGQRPIESGADIVVASLTKNVGGFGVDMGGVAVVPRELCGPLKGIRKDFGGVLPPASAWDFQVYGLSTLPVRLARQVQTSRAVAEFLASHPAVSRVSYPGLPDYEFREIAEKQMRTPEGEFCPGHMIYFELAGDPEISANRRERFINYLAEHAYSIMLAVSLGMTKTLIEAPGLMTHSSFDPETQMKLGIHPGGIRLAIGLEDARDVILDLSEALENSI
ncbi:MAG TPA: PLP-dependent transferase [Myxococcota bacterium]|nr:PLP-dependent transferase [Myxococcota bacterium]